MSKSLVTDIFEGIKKQDRTCLAQGISLVESKNPEHKKVASELISLIIPLTGKSKRIGISGTPGVGKSTFLENYGMYLIRKGHKIAVLAIDPTSQKTGGSILGDKTRMSELSASDNAFIRPSPNGPTLGGIAAKTREAMLLCEAYGFDYVFIETVGVGQSEISVSHLVDMFILLMQPGSGDELQGIKRGILEVSHLVIVNKSDGDFEKISEMARHDYQRSIEILQAQSEWKTQVLRASSLNKTGFDEIYKCTEDYFLTFDSAIRDEQLSFWVRELLIEKFQTDLTSLNIEQSLTDISKGKINLISFIEETYKKITHDKN